MNQEKPKSVLAWYSTFTSVQGLVQFFASKNVVSKTYWFIIFAVSTIATFGQVYTVFEDYLSYNVVTDVKVIQNSSIDFPSVTICNTNRVHCGNLLKYASTCENVSLCLHTCFQVTNHISNCFEIYLKNFQFNEVFPTMQTYFHCLTMKTESASC